MNNEITTCELFETLDEMLKNGAVRLAIEGGSASGKTTLASLLQSRYDATVFHMDDFFLRPHQRTSERLAEVGGNVDRERFLNEVLLPLSQNQPILYQRFDCQTQLLEPPIQILPKRLTVIEGAYSMHPDLSEYYDLSVFLNVDPEPQRARIRKRNTPQMAERFFGEWIPLEHRYFEETDAKNRCDFFIRQKQVR
jgi:uridine kinase